MALLDKTGREIKRGDVYFMEPPLYNESTILIEKIRPYLVHRVDNNAVVASAITESDKSKYPNYYVRIFDKRRNKYKFIDCHTMTTIPVEKIDNLCFTLSDYNLERVTKLTIKNIHGVNLEAKEGSKEEPIPETVTPQPVINEAQKEIMLEVIKQHGKFLDLVSKVLNLEVDDNVEVTGKVEEPTSIEISNSQKEEPVNVNPNLKPDNIYKQKVDPKFLDENNARNYTVLYMNGQFDTIKNVYGDTKNLAHNRIKYIKANFENVQDLFEEKKKKGRRPSYTKEDNIDYAKHVKDKDFTYIYNKFGHTEEKAKKRVSNMKSRFDYIREMF